MAMNVKWASNIYGHAALVLYILGGVFLPEFGRPHRLSVEFQPFETLMCYMYFSYGFFPFVGILFSWLFDNKIAIQMTLAFYFPIPILSLIFSTTHTEYLFSSICLIIMMVLVVFRVSMRYKRDKDTVL